MEVLVPKVATVLGRIEVKQVISTNWPENYISDTYSKVFPEGAISTVGSVTFLNSDGTLSDLTSRGLLQGFNAIDFNVLFDGGFLEAVPKSVSETSQDFSNYLWLLEKSITAGGTGAVASRKVAVFKLISVEEIAGSDLVDLTYRLLFGGDFSDQHPVASIQEVTTDEDIPIRVILSGTDLESCELTFLIEEQPSDGVLGSIFDNLCVAGDPNTDSASVIYLPDPNFNGADSFIYSVIDGNGDDIASIEVKINVVNDAPVFTVTDQKVDEDSGAQSMSITGVSPGPSDEVDADQKVSFTATSNKPAIIPNPTISGSGASRTLSYTPVADQNGPVTITVVANDAQGANNTTSKEFKITVDAVNDPPVFAVTDQKVDEDSGAQTMSITGVSPGPSDEVDAGQKVSFTATASPSSIISDPTISSSGASRTLSYTPVADQNGTVTITVVANDGQGANNTTSKEFKITVDAVNDPPDAVNDVPAVAEDSVNNVIDVLSNDTIAPDIGETLTVVAVTQGTSGAVVIGAGGTEVLYTPNGDFIGDDSFTYTINDGTPGSDDTATVTITVESLTPPQTSPLISGNGSIGGLDPFNEVSVDGGTTWQPAHIVAKNAAWAIIPGTQYIFCGPTISDPCGTAGLPGISTLYRTTFTLPSGFNNPSIAVDVHADNAAIVYLNGVEIGRYACHQDLPTPSCSGEFSDPPETFSTSDSSLFQEGQNILSFDLWDFGGDAGLDYEATVNVTVFQDTFDSESLAGNATTLANWTVTAGNVDVIGPGFANIYDGNGNYLDMSGCTNGTIQSPLLNLPPGTYRLSFEIGNNPDGLDNNRLQVTLAPLFNENFDAPAALTLITRTFNVTTSTTASLVFKEIGTENCGGTVLDDVLLTLVSAT